MGFCRGAFGVRAVIFPRQSSEGPLLAASRSASATTTSATNSGSRRVSFARIQEPLKVPDLLALQTESFDWLLGNEKWRERVEAERKLGEINPLRYNKPETPL